MTLNKPSKNLFSQSEMPKISKTLQFYMPLFHQRAMQQSQKLTHSTSHSRFH